MHDDGFFSCFHPCSLPADSNGSIGSGCGLIESQSLQNLLPNCFPILANHQLMDALVNEAKLNR